MVYFKDNYCFPRFQRNSFHRSPWGGGGKHFSWVRVNMLLSIETNRTYDFPGAGRPYTTSESAHALIC